MRYFNTLILVLCSWTVFAQGTSTPTGEEPQPTPPPAPNVILIDSMKLYVKNFQIQTRDAELLVPLLAKSEIYEDLYLALIPKFKLGVQGSSVITIDSVRADALAGIGQYIRSLPYVQAASFFQRIDVAIRSFSYLDNYFNVIDQSATESMQAIRQDGRRRLRGIRQ